MLVYVNAVEDNVSVFNSGSIVFEEDYSLDRVVITTTRMVNVDFIGVKVHYLIFTVVSNEKGEQEVVEVEVVLDMVSIAQGMVCNDMLVGASGAIIDVAILAGLTISITIMVRVSMNFVVNDAVSVDDDNKRMDLVH